MTYRLKAEFVVRAGSDQEVVSMLREFLQRAEAATLNTPVEFVRVDMGSFRRVADADDNGQGRLL